MCRVETTHDSPAAAERYSRAMGSPESRPWNGAVLITRGEQAGGGVALTTYLFREDVTPQLD